MITLGSNAANANASKIVRKPASLSRSEVCATCYAGTYHLPNNQHLHRCVAEGAHPRNPNAGDYFLSAAVIIDAMQGKPTIDKDLALPIDAYNRCPYQITGECGTASVDCWATRSDPR